LNSSYLRPLRSRAVARRLAVPARAWLLLPLLALLALARPAGAQALDELRYVDRDRDAVLQIHFNVRVQIQRYAPQVASDIFEVYFQVVGGDEAQVRPVEESLSTPEGSDRPQATVIYPVQPGAPVKKIVVRLDRVVTFKVKPGQNNQMVEVILPGLAQKVATVPVPVVDRNRFAISLETVPISQKDSLRPTPSRFQNYAVFGSQRVVGGADVYEVDLGFFETREAAEAVRRDALVDFPQAQVFDVSQRKEETQRGGKAPATAAAPPAVAIPVPVPVPAPVPVPVPVPVPAPSAAAAVAPVAAAAGSPEPPPAPGPNADAPAAPAALTGTAPAPVAGTAPQEAAAFPPATPGPRIEGAAPLGPGAAAARIATAAEVSELERDAGDLMKKSRDALTSGHNEDAVGLLNQLLLLPPNKFSQDAQELVGLARERSGEAALARKEYELYLRLFPQGDGARRVRQRLASLAPPEQATTTAAKPKEKREPTLSYGGTLAQSYFGGNSAVQSQTQTAILGIPTQPNQQTITNSTQSAVVTAVDLNARYRSETNDARIVFRDTEQKSLLKADPSLGPTPSSNRMDALYVDWRNEDLHSSVRAGRQAGVAGGLVGRFDGVGFSFDLPSKLRLNMVAGAPVDKVVDSKQRFEGVNLEAQNLAEHWGATGFLINQSAEGVTDRRALGAEVRYFEVNRSLFTLLDYDVNFHALNAVTVQGNYTMPDQTNFSLLLDDRKAPILAASNGLVQYGCPTFADAYAGNLGACTTKNPLAANGAYTLTELRQSAIDTTAAVRQAAIDVSHPFGQHWQVSADLRMTNIGKLLAINTSTVVSPGTTAGTGNVRSLSLQATGSNLYSKRDINVFALTHMQSPVYRGDQLSFSNLNSLMNNLLTLEPSISFYHQRDTVSNSAGASGQTLRRVSPGLHGAYKVAKRVYVDSFVSSEQTRVDGQAQTNSSNSTQASSQTSTSTRNTFFYIGYRLDLN
jgi:hypothetical protein